MPALPDVPNGLRVRFRFINSDGGPVAHVGQWYRWSGTAPTVADCTAIANEAMNLYDSHLKENAHGVVICEGVDVTDMSSSSGASSVSTHATIAGTASGDALPQKTAVCVRYTISRRVRGGQPREFWPFGTQAEMTNELEWSSAFVTQVDDDLGAFYDDFEGYSTGGVTVARRSNVSYYFGFTVHTGVTGRARNVSTPRTSPVMDDATLKGALGFISQQRRRRGRV